MKRFNFLSKSSSRSCGHRVTTLASTVGSPSAHRRGAMLRLLSVLVLILTIGVGNVWGTEYPFIESIPTGWTASSDPVDYETTSTSTTFQRGAKWTGNFTLEFDNASNVTEIAITCSANNAQKGFSITIGGNAWGGATQSLSSGWRNQDKTFSGNATSGKIIISYSHTKKSVWIQKITVTTSSGTSYTITYDSNGGSGSMGNTTGSSVSAATCTFTAPTGKQFDHWNTDANNSGTSYAAGDAVNTTTTLYAQWACIEPTINTQPASANYAIGATPAALSVSATLSSGTLTSLWKVSTNGGSTWSNASGTNNQATYAAANISTAAAGTTKYKCIVTNSSGSCETESNVATITVYPTHKAYFYNGSTLLNSGGTDVAEGAAVNYSGLEPVTCDEGEGASTTFVGWATGTWSGKKAAKGDIPGGTTFYDVTASQSLPNMSTSDVTYYAVFAKASSGGVGSPTEKFSVDVQVANGNLTAPTGYTLDHASEWKNGAHRQDGSNDPAFIKIYHTSTKLFSSLPAAITIKAELYGGSARDMTSDGSDYYPYVFFTDDSGDEIVGSAKAICTSVTTSAAEKSVSMTVSDATNAYGIGIRHAKISGFNLRYKSITLEYATSSTSYSNYMTTCCSSLGSINGSINLSHF